MVDSATCEVVIRSIGGVFQLGGIATVAAGIRGTRKELNRPGMFGRTKSWLLSFRRRDAEIRAVPIRSSVTVSSTVDGVLSRSWEGLDADERLDELKGRIDRLEDKIVQHKQEMDRRQVEHTKALAQERSKRIAADNDAAGRVDKLSGGNLRVEALGAVLFAIGIVLATWASEIAHMFR